MQKGIIGKKVGMTQVFDENGKVTAVTVIEAGPCAVVQRKTKENDGYEAVQLGFGDMSVKRVTKPRKGHFDKADVAPKRTLREFRLDDCSGYSIGDIVKADVFASGIAEHPEDWHMLQRLWLADLDPRAAASHGSSADDSSGGEKR